MKKLLLGILLFLGVNLLSKPIMLTNKNSVSLRGVIAGATVSKVMHRMAILDSRLPKRKPIYLVIYSPGGYINTGYEFIEFAKGLNRPIHTVVIFAASMAFIIHESLGKRYIFPYGTLMAHKAYGGFEGEFPGQIDSQYKFWLRRLEKTDSDIARRLDLSVEAWQEMYENEYWVNGFDTIRSKFSDEIANFKCGKSLRGTMKERFSFFGINIIVTWSKCPLITEPLKIDFEMPESKETSDKASIKKILKLYYNPMDSELIKEINILQIKK